MAIRDLVRVSIVSVLLLGVSCDDWPGTGDGGAPPAGGDQIEDTSGLLGSSCGGTVSCRGNLVCVTVAPGGLCTRSCASDDDCDQVGSCQYVPEWGGLVCLKRCASDSRYLLERDAGRSLHGLCVRPLLTVGMVSLFGRLGWLPRGDRKTFAEVGVLLKAPINIACDHGTPGCP